MPNTVQTNGKSGRMFFGNVRTKVEIPDLIEVQRHSYAHFLQHAVPAKKRENIGLQSVFQSVFPIDDYNKTARIEFLDYSIGPSKYDVAECLERGMTFNAPLKARVRLIILEKENKGSSPKVREIREQEVYIGELPLMTPNGTFVINGTERVVVNQLQRSPGVFFTHDKGRNSTSGKVSYSARVIPYRGSWMDFEFDTNDVLHVRIDRRRKIPVTVLLKAFGLSSQDILTEYYPTEHIAIRDRKFFRKFNPEIHTGLKITLSILDREKAVVVKSGGKLTRAQVKKLKESKIKEIPLSAEELIGRVLLDQVNHPKTGKKIIDRNEMLTEEMLTEILSARVKQLKLLFIDNIQVLPVIRDTLGAENVSSRDEALVEIYRRLRPGEAPTVETARLIFQDTFFNPKRYDLSPVGRLKINKRLGLDSLLEQRTLTAADLTELVRHLVDLNAGKGEVDDIDHLGNRRVRSVGELLENQLRVGLVRMERNIRERMNLLDIETVQPHDLINAKPIIAVIKEFFGSSQLCQFMDQTNPLAEITHKRRLSALGPGGLTRERAGFEVRDVHPSHYGRICPIETPEGPNIGLITSLSTYARINEFGFIESPYRKVVKGLVTNQVVFVSAIEGDQYVIAQANTPTDGGGKILTESVSARYCGNFVIVVPEKVDYMEVSPKHIVSVATALIPFLENDDANRALMGSNMQRQAVPLIETEAPLVGTGMEGMVARDSGYVVLARRPGVVERVDANSIVVRADRSETGKKDRRSSSDVYQLIKFKRSNQSSRINQKPIVDIGQRVQKDEVIADGPAMDQGELALGRNILVAFMSWGGYNYEDAILVSERLVKDDIFTSIHIEEFEIESRDTKLGKEDMTRDIPSVSEEALKNLDESGIVRLGAEVKQGDILVGKVTPKGETQLTPEEKLLRAIFGEKAGDVKDASLYVPPAIDGIVVDVKIFSRKGAGKDERAKAIEGEDIAKQHRVHRDQIRIIEQERLAKIKRFVLDKNIGRDILETDTGEVLIRRKTRISRDLLLKLKDEVLKYIVLSSKDEQSKLEAIDQHYKEQFDELQSDYDEKIGRLKSGDELPPGVIKLVRVYVAMKRKLQVGDKMAGRHGNKGVVARVLPQEDLPCLPDGTPVEIVLNPLGVPSRMNVGQIMETHLGWAARALGLKIASPVFDGAMEKDIKDMLEKANLPVSGQSVLFDGKTGEPFRRPVTVGYVYMMKLHHLVDEKIHARSIGPYSLVTQQPLGGKAQFGGQRLGEMEVWALQAYGAASTLQEFLTVKSDDVPGRARVYEAIVKSENFLEPGLPESFNVLIKELQSLGMDIELVKSKR